MKSVLTIAGSDSSGGAGIQADIKTITAHNMYAMSAITALTAQNTTGVYGVCETPAKFVGSQIDCIFSDIYPDAVKIGMASGKEIIEVISDRLAHYEAKNIVVDPVMISTSGSRLLAPEAIETLIARLFPLAALITPNLPEAEALCGFAITGKDDMLRAAKALASQLSCSILIKGGHLDGDASDLLLTQGEVFWFQEERVHNPNTHGTGCTLSSAIACSLAGGYSLPESVRRAKSYLTGALKAQLNLGKGSGPLDHMYLL